eukprot:5565232-Heterocapsa_arctica.AAC.1
MDGVQPSFERFPERTSKDSQTFSIKLKGARGGLLDLTPIIALIPKEGAENEGLLRPIACLPYIYRVWMAVRKSKVKQCAMKLNDGRFSSPGIL